MADWGEGFNFMKSGGEDGEHPAGEAKNGQASQAEKAFSLASTFVSGILAINASQFLGLPLKMIAPETYDTYMAFTKQSFAVLVTTMTQWWAPTTVRVSGDASMKGQLIQEKDGSLRCDFPDRLVLMANHQLYTDWLYLWWIAYTNNMHGRIFIILKESLRKIPLIGWGAQAYNFIFLSRKWENDLPTFKKHLEKLNNPKDPMWLLIFPEGTNLAAGTRAASKRWADKNGLEDMRHQLLPRSTGLRFCLQELRNTTEWLYDCTIGYEGIPPGAFGQDIFTLRSSFFEGRPPKSVNMHWRRFKISDIPVDNPKAFEVWLRNRWREKDHLLEHFVHHNRFPADEPWKIKPQNGSGPNSHGTVKMAKYIETQVKSRSWEEFLSIFAPLSAFVVVLFFFYGASKGSLMNPGGAEAQAEQADLVRESSEVNATIPDDVKEQLIMNAKRKAAEKAVKEGNIEGVPKGAQFKPVAKEVKTVAGTNIPIVVSDAPKKTQPPAQRQVRKAPSVVSMPVSRPPAAKARANSAQNVPTLKSNVQPAKPTPQKTGAAKPKPPIASTASKPSASTTTPAKTAPKPPSLQPNPKPAQSKPAPPSAPKLQSTSKPTPSQPLTAPLKKPTQPTQQSAPPKLAPSTAPPPSVKSVASTGPPKLNVNQNQSQNGASKAPLKLSGGGVKKAPPKLARTESGTTASGPRKLERR